jgi:Tol biopolymer transport system component
MSLSTGSRLGPYEIVSSIGAGGMGEVWKARDGRLGRTVAIKVLSDRLAASEESRQRFEREARTISQLSHPHICALYDVGHEGAVEYLVMEYLEGESLADRLGRGPLPLSQAVRYAAEIASALAAAHRHGVVHRDLKPGNVMLTRTGVKLLDFGLARVLEPTGAIERLTSAPTAAGDLTREGVVLGTVSYMAPEQVEGLPADARTDIFALGTVLYEMVTGEKPFQGSSAASVMSAILTFEPPPVSVRIPISPPALDRLVAACLSKDPGQRWESAQDVSLQLRSIGETGSARAAPAPTEPAIGRWIPWTLAAAAAIAALALLLRRPAPAARPQTLRFPLAPPAGRQFMSTVEATVLAISPDGSRVAFIANGPPRAAAPGTGGSAFESGIWMRNLSALDPVPLEGTDGARSLFWSPDSRSVAFFTPGQIKRIDVAGGAPVTICEFPPGGGKSGTWGSRGDILFANIQGSTIWRVPATGGTPQVQAEADASRAETRLTWPFFLPDGVHYLLLVRHRDMTSCVVLRGSSNEIRTLLPISSIVQYSNGNLVFVRDGTLIAQPFDPRKGTLSGDPFSIAEHVAYFLTNGYAYFAASLSGTLVYQAHENASRLAWFDRSGREISRVGRSGNYLNVSIGRDGRRIFYDRTAAGIGTWDIWSHDLERDVETRVTSAPTTEVHPIEIPDGKTIVYAATSSGQPQLVRRDLATGREEPLLPGAGTFQTPQDLSPDGRTLLYAERSAQTPFDIWALPLSAGARPVPVVQSSADKQSARFSPDGRFVSFTSDESGHSEAYVAPFPGPGQRTRISAGGAHGIRWSSDGRELFYVSDDGMLMSVPVATSPSLQVGRPSELFRIPGRGWWIDFAVARDGRFLAIVPEVEADEQPLTVVVNWAAASGR